MKRSYDGWKPRRYWLKATSWDRGWQIWCDHLDAQGRYQ